MFDLGALWNDLTALVAVAFRSFALTLVGMIVVGFVLAGVSYALAAQTSVVRGLLAGLGAVLICTILGFIVAGQRAVAVALMRGLHERRLADAVFGLLVERLLGVSGQEPMGERGGKAVQALERMPLAQAETRLRDAVTALLNAPQEGGGPGGWMRRRLQLKLVRTIEDITLARLRQEGTTEGGVDLLRLRRKLGDTMDGLVISKVRRSAVRLTAFLVIIALVTCVALTLALQHVGA